MTLLLAGGALFAGIALGYECGLRRALYLVAHAGLIAFASPIEEEGQ